MRNLNLILRNSLSIGKRSTTTSFRCVSNSILSEPSEPLLKSSIPAGTVLKGLSYLKTDQDPVALAESEYPSWLFSESNPVLTPALSTSSFTKETAKKDLKYFKLARKETIKSNNFLKSKKR